MWASRRALFLGRGAEMFFNRELSFSSRSSAEAAWTKGTGFTGAVTLSEAPPLDRTGLPGFGQESQTGKTIAPLHRKTLAGKVRDHRLEILVLGNDVILRGRNPLDGLPKIKGQSQVERIVPGGSDLHQFHLGGQPVNLIHQREINFPLILPDQQRDPDRLPRHQPQIDRRDILEVHKNEMSENTRHAGGALGPTHPASNAKLAITAAVVRGARLLASWSWSCRKQARSHIFNHPEAVRSALRPTQSGQQRRTSHGSGQT